MVVARAVSGEGAPGSAAGSEGLEGSEEVVAGAGVGLDAGSGADCAGGAARAGVDSVAAAGSGAKHEVSQGLIILVVRHISGHTNYICRINIPVASPDWSLSCNRATKSAFLPECARPRLLRISMRSALVFLA